MFEKLLIKRDQLLPDETTTEHTVDPGDGQAGAENVLVFIPEFENGGGGGGGGTFGKPSSNR